MQRNTFTFPAIFLGFIANICLHDTAPSLHIYIGLLGMCYMLLMPISAIDNPIWYVLHSTALTVFQIVFQLNFQTGMGGIFYICVMILLYIGLALNILVAVFLFYYHCKEIRTARTIIKGRWAIVHDYEWKNVTPRTVLIFNDNHTGSCVDFYGMEHFTYKVNPKIGSDTWPYIQFTDQKNNICIMLDYQLTDDSDSNLQLGEEYAFEDDFRGYTDENGQLNLILEPIYNFKKVAQ